MGSSRFFGKPLAQIAGLSMIEHVRRRTALCQALDRVVVATCDTEIADEVRQHGGEAVMTADSHERCTDRIAEALGNVIADAMRAAVDAEIALVVQGDEPLLDPAALAALLTPFKDQPAIQCTNLLSVISDPAEMENPDIVKAQISETSRVMSYSRAPIPFPRVAGSRPMFRQTGLSAFRAPFLRLFTALPPTALEIVESIDFLRILGHDHPVTAVVFDSRTLGVERAEDVPRVEAILRDDPTQAALFAAIRHAA